MNLHSGLLFLDHPVQVYAYIKAVGGPVDSMPYENVSKPSAMLHVFQMNCWVNDGISSRKILSRLPRPLSFHLRRCRLHFSI